MKRRLVKLVVFLLLGAVVNVAVAWGLAVCVSKWWITTYTGMMPGPNDPPALDVNVHSTAGAIIIEAEKRRLAGPTVVPPLPLWSRAGTLTVADLQRGMSLVEHARGWPYVALYWRRTDQMGAKARIDGGIPVRSRPDAALPVLPVWPGFVINTVFYAVILWVLFAAPFALRRRRRIRRGLCPACAYPVGDSAVCTECGKPVTAGRFLH